MKLLIVLSLLFVITISNVQHSSSQQILSSLTLTSAGCTLNPAFSPTTTSYTCLYPPASAGTPAPTLSLSVTANSSSDVVSLGSGSKPGSNTGSFTINIGDSTISITVAPPRQGGNVLAAISATRTYRILVTRPASNPLRTLTCTGADWGYGQKILSYSHSVNNPVSSVNVTASCVGNGDQLTIQGKDAVPDTIVPVALTAPTSIPSTTSIAVKCSSANTFTTYTIAVTRKIAPTLSDASFMPLRVTMSPMWSPSITTYTLSIPPLITAITLNTKSSTPAKVEINGSVNSVQSGQCQFNLNNAASFTIKAGNDSNGYTVYTFNLKYT